MTDKEALQIVIELACQASTLAYQAAGLAERDDIRKRNIQAIKRVEKMQEGSKA